MRPRILIGGVNIFPSQLSRFVDGRLCEPVNMVHTHSQRDVRFDGSCDAAIICSAHISHHAHKAVREWFKQAGKPVFMTDAGASRIATAFDEWLVEWRERNPDALPDLVPMNVNIHEEPMPVDTPASVPLLIERVGKLEEAMEHLTDTVVSGLAKVEAANMSQVNALIDRAFQYDQAHEDILKVYLSIPEKKRKKAIAMLEMFVDD